MSTNGEPPLATLLGLAREVFCAEFDRRLHDSEFRALSLAHSANVLRHLGDGPRQASQIVSQCAVSKQAVSQQITHMERSGYVTVTPHPTDHRARVITLTDKGARAQAYVLRTFAEIEADWLDVLGPEDGPALRRILTVIASQLTP